MSTHATGATQVSSVSLSVDVEPNFSPFSLTPWSQDQLTDLGNGGGGGGRVRTSNNRRRGRFELKRANVTAENGGPP